jgi:hypothetical protein
MKKNGLSESLKIPKEIMWLFPGKNKQVCSLRSEEPG